MRPLAGGRASPCGPGNHGHQNTVCFGARRHVPAQRHRWPAAFCIADLDGSGAERNVARQSGIGQLLQRGQLDAGDGADRHGHLRRLEHDDADPGLQRQPRWLDIRRRGFELHLQCHVRFHGNAEFHRGRHHHQWRQRTINSTKVIIFFNTSTAGSAIITNSAFMKFYVGGFSGTVDYLTVSTRKSVDGRQYLASYGLAWNAGNNSTWSIDAVTIARSGTAQGIVMSLF